MSLRAAFSSSVSDRAENLLLTWTSWDVCEALRGGCCAGCFRTLLSKGPFGLRLPALPRRAWVRRWARRLWGDLTTLWKGESPASVGVVAEPKSNPDLHSWGVSFRACVGLVSMENEVAASLLAVLVESWRLGT